jgi:hypothetical protein
LEYGLPKIVTKYIHLDNYTRIHASWDISNAWKWV